MIAGSTGRPNRASQPERAEHQQHDQSNAWRDGEGAETGEEDDAA